MIKIERSTAVNATIVRNNNRQPVTLNMIVTSEELASLTADSGSIMYSVDEMEVKTIDFQPTTLATTVEPIPEAVPVSVSFGETVSITTDAKPVIQPARKTTRATKA